MNKKQLNHYRQLLLQEKHDLEVGLEAMAAEDNLSIKESTGELSAYDNHPADQASNTFGRELDRGIRDNSYTLLTRVNDALSKIEEGRYGVCQRCGKDIASDRLDIVPEANYCIECEEYANKEGVRDRPLAEAVLNPPFSRGFNDGTDKVEYDAEDAWQDVAQYGTSDTPLDVPETLTGDRPQKQAYLDSNEIIGSVGIEDSIIDDKVNDIEETDDLKTTFTGSLGKNHRQE